MTTYIFSIRPLSWARNLSLRNPATIGRFAGRYIGCQGCRAVVLLSIRDRNSLHGVPMNWILINFWHVCNPVFVNRPRWLSPSCLICYPLHTHQWIKTLTSQHKLSLFPSPLSQIFGEDNPTRGNTVLYFHGYASSRLEALTLHDEARELGLRLLAFDRSGYGRSSYDPDRTPQSAVQDAMAVLDAVLDRGEPLYIFGASGGTPYALEVAAYLKERVKSILLVSPMFPMRNREDLLESTSSKARETILDAGQSVGKTKLRLWIMRILQRVPQPKGFLLRLAGFPEVDIEAATVKYIEKGYCLKKSSLEGTRSGIQGPLRDLQCMATVPSRNDIIASIICPVRIWAGSSDVITPTDMTFAYQDILPVTTVKIIPDEGHFVTFPRTREVLYSMLWYRQHSMMKVWIAYSTEDTQIETSWFIF